VSVFPRAAGVCPLRHTRTVDAISAPTSLFGLYDPDYPLCKVGESGTWPGNADAVTSRGTHAK